MAKGLSVQTKANIVVAEANHSVGGHNQTVLLQNLHLNYGLKMIPALEGSHTAMDFLKTILNQELSEHVEELPPIVHGPNGWSPFVGFGDNAPSCADELAYYLQPKRYYLKHPIYTWNQALLGGSGAELLTQHQLTRFETENGLIKSAVLNGEVSVEAKAYIYTGSPIELLKYIPTLGEEDPKWRARLAKTKLWSTVSLNCVHKSVISEQENLYVLIGTGTNPTVVLGQFSDPILHQGKTIQSSQWLTFVTDEEANEEVQAQTLKELKRLMNKYFPNIFDKTLNEKVIIGSRSHGTTSLKFDKNFAMQEYPNLWIAGPHYGAAKNLIGAILQAQNNLLSLSKTLKSEEDPLEKSSKD